MPGNAHGHLVARPRLGELRDQRVPVIVPPSKFLCYWPKRSLYQASRILPPPKITLA